MVGTGPPHSSEATPSHDRPKRLAVPLTQRSRIWEDYWHKDCKKRGFTAQGRDNAEHSRWMCRLHLLMPPRIYYMLQVCGPPPARLESLDWSGYFTRMTGLGYPGSSIPYP